MTINTERSYLQTWKFPKICHMYISESQQGLSLKQILISPDCKIFGQKSRKLGEIWDFIHGGRNFKSFLDLTSSIYFTINLGGMSKFESKWSKSFDFITYPIFKDFDKKIVILRATLHPKMAMNFERNHLEAWNLAKMCHTCRY